MCHLDVFHYTTDTVCFHVRLPFGCVIFVQLPVTLKHVRTYVLFGISVRVLLCVENPSLHLCISLLLMMLLVFKHTLRGNICLSPDCQIWGFTICSLFGRVCWLRSHLILVIFDQFMAINLHDSVLENVLIQILVVNSHILLILWWLYASLYTTFIRVLF